MVHEKGMVAHYLTQNIDNLESKAGFTEEQINQAHGANFGAICAKCQRNQDQVELQKCISKGEVMYCKLKTGMAKKSDCEGPVKPKITFFGEQLPTKFLNVLNKIGDPGECDLLIVIGTALAVHPFASIVDEVSDKTPKVLINMTTTECYDFDN